MKHRFRLRFIINGDIIINRFISQFLMARPKLNTVILDYTLEVATQICDIPRGLSLLNRKSFRSGYVYSIDFIEYIPHIDQTSSDYVIIAKIPENYNTLAGYRLGFSHWREQRAMAIAETDIQPGKWSDFKPYYNEAHAVGAMPELLPVVMNASVDGLTAIDNTGSEWNRADMEVHDIGAATTTRYSIGMLGDSDVAATYGGLIDAWGDTRTATIAPDPLTPNVASQQWITRTGATSEEMSGEVIQLIEDENDFPPYANQIDVTLAPTYVGNGQSAVGGMLVDKALTGSTGRAINLDGGLFPLGLMVVTLATVGTGGTLRVHCTRGNYKGAVAALPMGDFS